MKALTVRQPYASLIAQGEKTIEVRSWPVKHRGELLIHSAVTPAPEWREEVKEEGLALGCAIVVVDLVDCRPLTLDDCDDAYLHEDDFNEGNFAWILENPRDIEPVPFKGQLNLWNFPDELIKYIK